jgi:hypothetical protein
MAQIVVLKRAHFFSIDNDIIDVHAKIIGANGIAIYAVLARYANRRTGECWPAISRVARTLRLARSTVKVYLRKLEEVGLIAIEERQDAAGDPTSNLYTLLDPSPMAVDKRLEDRAAQTLAALTCAAPEPEGGRAPADPPQAACRPGGRAPADPEPSSLPQHKEENQPEGCYAGEKETHPHDRTANPCTHPQEEITQFGDIVLCQHCWSLLNLCSLSDARGETDVHAEGHATVSHVA